MNRDRIQLAIDILRNVPDDKRFDMAFWAKFQHDHKEDETPSLKDECGTAGCAIGWIASDERARKLGLTLYVDMDGKWAEPKYTRRGRSGEDVTHYESAIHLFFGFEDSMVVEHLFSPGEYQHAQDRTRGRTRPQNVIDRLELLLAVGEKRFLEIMDGAYAPGHDRINDHYRFGDF